MTIDDVVQLLTIDDAKRYFAQKGEWWIWVDDNILSPNNLQTNERNVNAVECRLFNIIGNPRLVLKRLQAQS